MRKNKKRPPEDPVTVESSKGGGLSFVGFSDRFKNAAGDSIGIAL